MPPVVSVVGRSGSGKTTLLEKLIPLLRERGVRVGTIKHHAHGRVEVDVPGKDSWRHRQAGAAAVALASPETLFCIRDAAGLPLDLIAHRFLFDVDLVLTEGFFRSGGAPKIEISRAALGVPLLSNPADGLIAVVADWSTGAPVPHFGLEAALALAEFLQRDILGTIRPPQAEVLVDGHWVRLPEAAQEVLARVVRSLVGPGGDPGQGPPIELRLPGRRP
ncbi:MAG TPA: molybdopterin-guanine dinucleotide biosynthesis protein B [Candidatus Sulfotelmatobacter sp.]|nr:molybdopterin-guanine dinucleotide biosynthesis protein B [Candidatus Sulfotelmatobacter sp.]